MLLLKKWLAYLAEYSELIKNRKLQQFRVKK